MFPKQLSTTNEFEYEQKWSQNVCKHILRCRLSVSDWGLTSFTAFPAIITNLSMTPINGG